MPLAPTSLLVVALVLACLSISCGRRNSVATTAPAATAYTDGFEVVVLEVRDGAPANVRSLHLKEAEQAIQGGARALVPGDPLAIQKQLATGRAGDSQVLFAVETDDGGKQNVRLSFHTGNRTYVYGYSVDGSKITPRYSEYRDLAKSKVIRYAAE